MSRQHNTGGSRSQGTGRANAEWRLAALKKALSTAGPGAIGGLIGLIGSICCLLPALAIAVGLTGGAAATLVGLGRFRLYGIAAGLAVVGMASWFSLRRSRACCTSEEYKRRRIVIPLTRLAFFSAVYALLMYVVIPMVYGIG